MKDEFNKVWQMEAIDDPIAIHMTYVFLNFQDCQDSKSTSVLSERGSKSAWFHFSRKIRWCGFREKSRKNFLQIALAI